MLNLIDKRQKITRDQVECVTKDGIYQFDT